MAVDTSISPSVRNKRVMEALILALGSSEISKIVNIGTLRYFLEFTLRDMFSGTAFDLGPLWNTLAAEPGLTPEMIYPPLLQFREWEARLGITIKLPQPMQQLGRAELDLHLSRIQVKAADLERIFHEATPVRVGDGASGRLLSAAAPKSAAPPRAAPRLSEAYLHAGARAAPPREDGDGKKEEHSHPAGGGRAAGPSFLARNRTAVLAACAVIAVAGFVYGGFRLFGHHGTSTSLDRASAILKLEKARRVDYVVTAVIADPRWNGMSREERRKTVETIFGTLEADGVKSLVLRGPAGETRALASTVGGERTLTVE